MQPIERLKDSWFFNIPAIRRPIRNVHARAHVYISERMNDKLYLQLKYRKVFGRWIDFKNPTTFQEKLQWLKLYDRNPLYHQMVDKHDVKSFVAERIGDGHMFPTIGVWNRFDEIAFDMLPEEFVLKATHDSDSVYVCTDKDVLIKNPAAAKARVESHFNTDYFIWNREFPYKGLQRRIIAEPLFRDREYGYLRDFKFMCFNGEPRLFYVTAERGAQADWKQDFFDLKGNHLEIQIDKRQPTDVSTETLPELPRNLKKMIELARVLSKDTHFLRVDFYEINGKVYVGELTFFDYGGFARYFPEEYEVKFGEWLNL